MGVNNWRRDKWIRKLDRAKWNSFLDYTQRLLKDLGLGPDDERYAINVRNDSRHRFSLVLRDRLVFALSADGGMRLILMLPPNAPEQNDGVPLVEMKDDAFAGEPAARLYTLPPDVMGIHMERLYPQLLDLCRDLLKVTGKKTRYREHHIGDVCRMVFEPDFRGKAMDYVLDEKGEWPGEASGKHRSNNMDREYYCVGTVWDGKDNQLPRFMQANTWENGYDDKFVEKVKAVPVGSLLAAKTTYIRKENGRPISVLHVHGIGEVIGNPGDGKTLVVKWEKGFKPFTLDGAGAYRSTISEVHKADRIKAIFVDRKASSVEVIEDLVPVTDHPLNVILYGPPGTGKTYSTVDHSLAIIEQKHVELYEGEERSELRERFNALLAAKRIEMVTFHQSMSYEDFIEGIKPRTDEDTGELSYAIEDGIFKRMAVEAAFEYVLEDKGRAGTSLAFSDLFDTYVEDVADQLEQGKAVEIPLRGGGKITVTEVSSHNNLYLKHDDGKRHYTVSKSRTEKLFAAYPDLESIPNIYKDFRRIIGGSNASAYWAVLNQLKQRAKTQTIAKAAEPHAPSTVAYEDKVRAVELIDWQEPELRKVDARPYVLVIDEINRGNIAGIFGELITLIETDKRAGAGEGAPATLPYSKLPFTVPPNLYIIGTMNTADRSVEALDTALRRRFSFVEMQAKVDKIEPAEGLDVDLRKLLTAINGRLERLLDKDHHIGHSYFMSIEAAEDPERELRRVFKNKVLPLLEEYFYGDPRKVGAVLGKAWVKPRPKGGPELIKGFGLDDAAKEVFDVADPMKVLLEDFRSIYV